MIRLLCKIIIIILLHNICHLTANISGSEIDFIEPTVPILLKRLIISDTTEAVANINFPNNPGKILIINVSPLNAKAFADEINACFDKHITLQLCLQLSDLIKAFLHKQGVQRVHVIIPAQNTTNGDLRLAVVTGKFSINQL